jgi:hypothetical protein
MHSILIIQATYAPPDQSYILPLRSRLLTHGEVHQEGKTQANVVVPSHCSSGKACPVWDGDKSAWFRVTYVYLTQCFSSTTNGSTQCLRGRMPQNQGPVNYQANLNRLLCSCLIVLPSFTLSANFFLSVFFRFILIRSLLHNPYQIILQESIFSALYQLINGRNFEHVPR